jgi:Arc/MetJ-type ribon-helix-helix transcriptional regulator
MTAERISVILPPDVLAGARGAVNAGAADSLSAFVVDALRDRLSPHARSHRAGPRTWRASAAGGAGSCPA